MSRMHHDTTGSRPSAGLLALDPDELRRSADRLARAGSEFDAAGSQVPPVGTGAAAPLVALAVGAHLEAAAVIASEARVLSLAIDQVGTDLEIADARSALDLFEVRTES